MLNIALTLILILAVRWFIGPITFSRLKLGFNFSFTKIKFQKRVNVNEVLMNFLLLWRSELFAGIPTKVAFAHALQNQPQFFLPETRSALKANTKLQNAILRDANQSNAAQLKKLSALLNISEQTGAPLQDAIDVLIETCIHNEKKELLVKSELASTRATVVILATLPLLGICLSTIMGMNSLGWLFGNLAGWLTLSLALILEGIGLFWVNRIIHRALHG